MKIALTSTGCIINSSSTRILLIKHDVLGKWTAPGGHVEPNEMPHDAAIREIKEELGIDVVIVGAGKELNLQSGKAIQLPTPYCVLQVPSGQADDTLYCDFRYIVTADDSKELVLSEVLDAKWFSRVDLDEIDSYPSILKVAKELLL